jgi:hypothetical protein
MIKNIFILFGIILFLIINSQKTYAKTPGEIYNKNRKEILQEEINIFEGNVFIVINSKTKKKIPDDFLYRKMKIKALENLPLRFSQYRYPAVRKEWFELYYSLSSTTKFSIKNSFVIDQNIAAEQAYLVLTVPEEEIKSTLINPKLARDAVNRAFDDGTLIRLVKYSRVVSGERLKKVNKKIALRASLKLRQEKNTNELSKEIDEPRKLDDQTQKPGLTANEDKTNDILQEKTIDNELTQEVDESSKSDEKTTTEDELKNPIDCDLPLCEKINKKNNKDSSKETITKGQTKEPLKGTTIRENSELDDML